MRLFMRMKWDEQLVCSALSFLPEIDPGRTRRGWRASSALRDGKVPPGWQVCPPAGGDSELEQVKDACLGPEESHSDIV